MRINFRRKKRFYIMIFIITVYLCLFYLIMEIVISRLKAAEKLIVNMTHVVVHLDLKGAPNKLDYLTSLLPMLKYYGANGLMIEYEDMFPYEGKLVNLSATYRYEKEEVCRKTFVWIGDWSCALDSFIVCIKGPKIVVNLKHVIVHLDLKGAPNKLDYLSSLLPMLKYYGANGLMIEYEDMFPYEGKLVNLSATYRYEKEELQKFLREAIFFGFEIIPLVQTFGHLEHALKLQEFYHLREEPEFADSICPSQLETDSFIRNLMEQMITFHTAIHPLKYIHIGCDEVYHLNVCNLCKRRDMSELAIFKDHVRKVTDIVKKLTPSTRVIIWDDMLKSYAAEPTEPWTLQTEPMNWIYTDKIDAYTTKLINYPPNIYNVWIATAFKGADDRTSFFPNFVTRYRNHYNYLKTIHQLSTFQSARKFNFKGIVLTGWSRYSHMDPLCELLPVSIPSLVANLILIKAFKNGIYSNFADINGYKVFDVYVKDQLYSALGCQINEPKDNNSVCTFKEFDLYTKLKQYIVIRNKILDHVYKNPNHLNLNYYLEHEMVNLNELKTFNSNLNNLAEKLSKFEAELRKIMDNYYEQFVIEEFLSSTVSSLENMLLFSMHNLKLHSQTQIRLRNDKIKKDSMIKLISRINKCSAP